MNFRTIVAAVLVAVSLSGCICCWDGDGFYGHHHEFHGYGHEGWRR